MIGGVSTRTVLNGLFLAASVLFFAVLFINTLRDPPPPDVLSRWRLGPFWASRRLWAASAALFSITATIGVAVVIGQGVGAEWTAGLPWLLALGSGLALLAAGSLCFSLVLYRGPPAPRPQGF